MPKLDKKAIELITRNLLVQIGPEQTFEIGKIIKQRLDNVGVAKALAKILTSKEYNGIELSQLQPHVIAAAILKGKGQAHKHYNQLYEDIQFAVSSASTELVQEQRKANKERAEATQAAASAAASAASPASQGGGLEQPPTLRRGHHQSASVTASSLPPLDFSAVQQQPTSSTTSTPRSGLPSRRIKGSFIRDRSDSVAMVLTPCATPRTVVNKRVAQLRTARGGIQGNYASVTLLGQAAGLTPRGAQVYAAALALLDPNNPDYDKLPREMKDALKAIDEKITPSAGGAASSSAATTDEQIMEQRSNLLINTLTALGHNMEYNQDGSLSSDSSSSSTEHTENAGNIYDVLPDELRGEVDEARVEGIMLTGQVLPSDTLSPSKVTDPGILAMLKLIQHAEEKVMPRVEMAVAEAASVADSVAKDATEEADRSVRDDLSTSPEDKQDKRREYVGGTDSDDESEDRELDEADNPDNGFSP